MKCRPFMMQGICLGMILVGMNAVFYHAFFPYISMSKFSLALMLAGIWFTMLSVCPFQPLEERTRKRIDIPFIKNPVACLFLFLTLAFLVAHVLQDITRYQNDAIILRNALIHQYNIYYGKTQGGFWLKYYETNGSRLLFLAEVLLAFGMAKAFSSRKSLFWGLIPVMAVISGGLLVGKAPEMFDMVCIASGTLGMRILNNGKRVGGRKHFRQITKGNRWQKNLYPIMTILLVLVFLTAGVLSKTTEDVCLQGEEKLLYWQHSLEKKAVKKVVKTVQRIRLMTGIERPGILTNVAPVYTGDTVLNIHADRKPQGDLYLRGFTGTQYQDGRWTNPEGEEMEGLFTQEEYYQFLCQSYKNRKKFYRSKLNTDVQEIQMEIEFAKGTRSSYGYFPYYSEPEKNFGESLILNRDLYFQKDKAVDRYTVNSIQNNLGIEDSMMSMVVLLDEETASVLKERAGTDEGEGLSFGGIDTLTYRYCRYILDKDLQLPVEGLTRTRNMVDDLLEQKLLKQGEHSLVNHSAREVFDFVKKYLGGTTRYSQNLKTKPLGMDYVENFLFEQKEGFCEHYATAGAVIFRMMGVPARYVSGYRISPEDFQKNEDGTYTAEVIDSRAHAWTEVYIPSLGWTVADMTPAGNGDGRTTGNRTSFPGTGNRADETNALETEPSVSSEELVEPSVSPEEEEATSAPQTEQQEQNEKKEIKGNKKTLEINNREGSVSGKNKIKLFMQIGGVVLAVVLSVFLWYGQAVFRGRRLKRCRKNRDAILEMNRLMEQYLRCCGIRGVSRMTDREYLRLLERLYPAGRQEGQLEKYYQIIERARFAREDCSREDIVWCETLLLHLGKSVIMKTGVVRRFYVRNIRNWRRR